MNKFKIILGLLLFFTSSIIVQLLGTLDLSLIVSGTDYLPDFTSKILDTLAGSLIIWGLIGVSPRGKKKK